MHASVMKRSSRITSGCFIDLSDSSEVQDIAGFDRSNVNGPATASNCPLEIQPDVENADAMGPASENLHNNGRSPILLLTVTREAPVRLFPA